MNYDLHNMIEDGISSKKYHLPIRGGEEVCRPQLITPQLITLNHIGRYNCCNSV